MQEALLGTWFGAFRNRSIVDLVLKLGPVVVHVNNIDVQINGRLHLISIDVHCVSPQLWKEKQTKAM